MPIDNIVWFVLEVLCLVFLIVASTGSDASPFLSSVFPHVISDASWLLQSSREHKRTNVDFCSLCLPLPSKSMMCSSCWALNSCSRKYTCPSSPASLTCLQLLKAHRQSLVPCDRDYRKRFVFHYRPCKQRAVFALRLSSTHIHVPYLSFGASVCRPL